MNNGLLTESVMLRKGLNFSGEEVLITGIA